LLDLEMRRMIGSLDKAIRESVDLDSGTGQLIGITSVLKIDIEFAFDASDIEDAVPFFPVSETKDDIGHAVDRRNFDVVNAFGEDGFLS
jgi:hypothetical protein